MEPTSYCGASRGHVHYENFILNEQDPVKVFQRNEVDEETFWLDMKNCSGVIGSKTFSLLPKLEILNLTDCKIHKVGDNSFGCLSNLKSLDVRGSTFPTENNTFTNCKLNAIYLSDLEIKLENLFSLKYLEEITFTNCTFSVIKKEDLSGFATLKILTFISCKINKVNCDAFDELQHLQEIRLMECNIEFLDCSTFLKLNSLKYLSLYANAIKSNINYEVFTQLPLLESIFFDLDIYKELDFSQYSKLKTVRIGYGNDEKVDEEPCNSLISKLSDNNLNYELVFTGKVEVNMDDVQICG